MAFEQRFRLRETVPGLPGEWICADPSCEAPMVVREGDSAAGMKHADGCQFGMAGATA